ncbi:MAG: methyltransferase, TIGR04325 family [Opitutae bacterium]|nr:methyltransferase, TIGR04325 family [Opitutae bacterium]
MKTKLKTLLLACLPAWLQRRWQWQWFRGDCRSWAEARAASVGYDDAAILQRAVAAARAVRAGQAAWERDGTLFTEPAVHAPLLAALRRAAEENGRHLAVLDFGGALGSTWWQHRPELTGLTRVDWRVVEQAAFVAAGCREFTDATLGFYPTVAAACEDGRPNTLLLSSVLQYLETPRQLLADMIARDFAHIIIDRTSFARDGRERLVVQHTPPALGGGSYPCWIFDRRQMTELFDAKYELVAEWPGFDDVGDRRVEFRGFHYRRKPHAGRI